MIDRNVGSMFYCCKNMSMNLARILRVRTIFFFLPSPCSNENFTFTSSIYSLEYLCDASLKSMNWSRLSSKVDLTISFMYSMDDSTSVAFLGVSFEFNKKKYIEVFCLLWPFFASISFNLSISISKSFFLTILKLLD